MDWRQAAADKLRGYETNRLALESIPLELERLRLAYTGLRAAHGGGVSCGGGNREEAMLSNISQREALERRLREAQLWADQVDKALAALTEEDRLVLDWLYIHPVRGNIHGLCRRLHLEKSAVYERSRRALHRFAAALYGGAGK